METENIQKGTGLLPLPENRSVTSDFSHMVVFGATKAQDIPFDFTTGIKPIKIKDQGNLDFCAGYGSSGVSEDQEGIELDPLWQFAQIKRIIMRNGGTLESYGSDLRSAGLSLVTYGSLPQKFSPFTIASGPRNFLADYKNWPPDLSEKALKYKKKSMFFVDGPEGNDDFDNIRAVLYMNKSKKVSVIAGVLWRRSWATAPGGVIPETGWENERGDGHCIKIFDQKIIDGKIYCVVQNSWGENVGDKGEFYFPREVINREFAPYGQIYFSDMPREDAEYYNENGISVHDYWFVAIFKAIYHLFF